MRIRRVQTTSGVRSDLEGESIAMLWDRVRYFTHVFTPEYKHACGKRGRRLKLGGFESEHDKIGTKMSHLK